MSNGEQVGWFINGSVCETNAVMGADAEVVVGKDDFDSFLGNVNKLSM